jgi:HEAT repeat protein
MRVALAVALGQLGDARGRSLLQGLLVDAEAEVRRAAAFALGQLGAKEATRALIVAAVDDDAEVGSVAVEALGKLGAPLADVRRALGALDAAEAWRRLAPPLPFREPGTVAAAIEGLAADDPAVRRGAAFGLAREPRPAAAETLRALLGDGDAAIRAWAARGLSLAGSLDDLTRLLPLLDDAAPSPRVLAVRAGAALLAQVRRCRRSMGRAARALVAGRTRRARRRSSGRRLPHASSTRCARASPRESHASAIWRSERWSRAGSPIARS